MINRHRADQQLTSYRRLPTAMRWVRTAFCPPGLLLVLILMSLIGCGRTSPTPVTSVKSPSQSPETSSESHGPSADSLTNPVPAAVPRETQHDEKRDNEDAATETSAVDPLVLYEQALQAMESGHVEQAFQWVRSAKSHAPQDPEITFLMARVLAERNRFAEAIKLLDDLSAQVPETRLPILGQTADWLVLHGKWQDAEDRYRALLNEVPDATMAQRALAQLMIRQGRRLEAATYLRQMCREGVVEPTGLKTLLRLCYPLAGETTDDESEPITALGRARAALADGNWDQALAALHDAHDESRSIEALTGRIHAERDDFDSLARWVEDCTSPIDDAADYWFAVAVHHAHQSRGRDAVAAFSRSALLDPTDDQIYKRLQPLLSALQWNESSEDARRRADQIEKTHLIAQSMNQGGQADPDQAHELAELLAQLNRPYESLAWRTVEISLRHAKGELSAEQAAQSITAINELRLQQLRSAELDPQSISGSFVPDTSQ